MPGESRPIPVPSVTQVLRVLSKGEALTQWAANAVADVFKARLRPGVVLTDTLLEEVYKEARGAHKGESRSATDLGSEVHDVLEGYLNTVMVGSLSVGDALLFQPDDERVLRCVQTGIDWLVEEGLDPISTERLIYSKKHSYCGMVDLIALRRDQLVLVDWKTSKAIYEEYELQVGAYVAGYEEETGERIEEAQVVRLDKTGAPFDEDRDVRRMGRRELRAAFKAFKGLLDVHKWQTSK